MGKDQEQFFKDLGATAEQTVEEVRGIEENYFSLLQKATAGLPWVADLNKKLQTYADQNIAAALDFSHKLSQAKDFQDLAHIQAEFMQAQINAFGEQAKAMSEASTKASVDAFKPPL